MPKTYITQDLEVVGTITGSAVTASFYGNLLGTSSYANFGTTSSFAATASSVNVLTVGSDSSLGIALFSDGNGGNELLFVDNTSYLGYSSVDRTLITEGGYDIINTNTGLVWEGYGDIKLHTSGEYFSLYSYSSIPLYVGRYNSNDGFHGDLFGTASYAITSGQLVADTASYIKSIATGAPITIVAESGGSTSGDISISTQGGAGDSGDISISTQGAGTNTGNITIDAADASSGTGGSILIGAGASSGGTDGVIKLIAPDNTTKAMVNDDGFHASGSFYGTASHATNAATAFAVTASNVRVENGNLLIRSSYTGNWFILDIFDDGAGNFTTEITASDGYNS